MMFPFEQDPLDWVHPFYRPHTLHGWRDFIRPALETMNSVNQMLQMADPDFGMFNYPRHPIGYGQNSDKYEIQMNVQQFSPKDLTVKMVDNSVVIEGKHEEKQDETGFISRHFVRRFQLPGDVKPESITCNLSSDGVLSIAAPRTIEKESANERSVPIKFTGKPAIKQADSKNKSNEATQKDVLLPIEEQGQEGKTDKTAG